MDGETLIWRFKDTWGQEEMAPRIFLFSSTYRDAREALFAAVPRRQEFYVVSSQTIKTNNDLKKHSHSGGGDSSCFTITLYNINTIKQDRHQKPPIILHKHKQSKNII